jgi:two-component system cell cycle sensor histidine kinase/response regulator CckA
MVSREEYINTNYDNYLYYWSNIAIGFGFFVILSLIPLDYLVAPSHFKHFLAYRIIASLCFAVIFVFNRKKVDRGYQSTLSLIAGTIVALMIALMIRKFDGHQSVYFAGFVLLIIYVFGLIPFTLQISLVAALTIYSIYLLPILAYDTITNASFFISANVFILACTFTLLLLRYLSHKRLMNEFSLEYDLDQDKQKLELYSNHLEQLVEERTKELNKSELMFRSLFEYANDGIILMDRTGEILNVNQEACEIHGFGREALIGTNIALLETEENKLPFRERMERILRGESLLFETQHYRKDGTKVSLEVSARALDVEGKTLVQAFHRDITEKKKLQRQLMHSQKMDSIGQLAGGIAHDFNNILTSVLGSAEHILMKEDLEESVARKVKNIESAARRAAQMVSKLLSFARRGSFEPVVFNVNSVIIDTIDIIARLIPREISLTKNLHEPLPAAGGDPSQIEQVVMNLILNARDAMPEGGEIKVKTDVAELGPKDLDIDVDIMRGSYVHISVSDTGIGVPEEHIPHIFEPFYTTKEKGKGTGLGLAMVYGIVKEHGGYITARSKVGEGTTFHVYLPVSKQRAAPVEAGSGVGGNETILVIDDEVPVLEFIKETLSDRGFNVILTDNPVNGLEIYRRNPAQVDLVITDIVMPAMSGNQLIRDIRSIEPQTRIIASTGFSESIGDVSIDGFLRKPFSSKTLLLTVRDVLDRPAGQRN